MQIYEKIKFHPFYLFFLFTMLVTGHFKSFFLFQLLLLVHEIGHIVTGYYFHWKIETILILPLGALTIFHEPINRPLKEEFWITCMGPITQVLFYLFFCKYFGYNSSFQLYHYALLYFNLLPILPLDGSKLLNIGFNYIFPFRLSHFLSILCSILFLCLFFFFLIKNSFQLILFLSLLFLGLETLKAYRFHVLLFERFLLERYQKTFYWKKNRYIMGKKMTQMKRDHRHLFIIDGLYVSEREVLKKRFDRH